MKNNKYIIRLIKEEINKIFFEASYTKEDIPRNFWLVTNVEEGDPNLDQIISGELHGVKGISSSKQIVVDWLGIVRNAVIVIPSKSFLEMNKVSRVMYDNPHYLVSNNMEAFFRLTNKNPSDSNSHHSIMQNLFDYIKHVAKSKQNLSKDFKTILYYIDYGTLSASWFGDKFQEQKPEINNIKDLATWIKKASIEVATERDRYESLAKNASAVSVEEWYQVIFDAFKMIGKTYKSENEWLVKGDTLRIPAGSTMFVSLPVDPKDISDKAKEEYSQDKEIDHWDPLQYQKLALKQMEFLKNSGLEKRYRLNFISTKKFENYKNRFWSRGK